MILFICHLLLPAACTCTFARRNLLHIEIMASNVLVRLCCSIAMPVIACGVMVKCVAVHVKDPGSIPRMTTPHMQP